MPSASTLRDLQTRTILSALQPDNWNDCSPMPPKSTSRQGVIFLQDKEADAFYIVREGKVQIQVPAISGPGVEVRGARRMGCDRLVLAHPPLSLGV